MGTPRTHTYILYASPARDIMTNGTPQAEEAGSGRLATRPLRQDGQEVRPRAIPRRHATVSPLPPPFHHNLCTDAAPSKTSTSSEASSRRSTRRQPGTARAVWTSPPLRGSEACSEDGHTRWKSSLRVAGFLASTWLAVGRGFGRSTGTFLASLRLFAISRIYRSVQVFAPPLNEPGCCSTCIVHMPRACCPVPPTPPRGTTNGSAPAPTPRAICPQNAGGDAHQLSCLQSCFFPPSS